MSGSAEDARPADAGDRERKLGDVVLLERAGTLEVRRWVPRRFPHHLLALAAFVGFSTWASRGTQTLWFLVYLTLGLGVIFSWAALVPTASAGGQLRRRLLVVLAPGGYREAPSRRVELDGRSLDRDALLGLVIKETPATRYMTSTYGSSTVPASYALHLVSETEAFLLATGADAEPLVELGQALREALELEDDPIPRRTVRQQPEASLGCVLALCIVPGVVCLIGVPIALASYLEQSSSLLLAVAATAPMALLDWLVVVLTRRARGQVASPWLLELKLDLESSPEP